ncbi:hypothetical protein GE107_18225 [Cohnella sp. CFH 77786]|uniref:hypothetical protein n=1 Tax=Cohnella sp. CFH 77786 TaxID=2662265 RepID=UPI001C60FC0E|nr:hypothetical protein [Cohnella sp. CFH 77786]MBW5447996.1 hypothetical protein [Cohnella sp. CFH 77786]
MTPRYITMKGPRARNGQPEWDSDVNEDSGREMLLDRSFDDWVAGRIEDQTERQEAITQAPHENAFEAAERLDDE